MRSEENCQRCDDGYELNNWYKSDKIDLFFKDKKINSQNDKDYHINRKYCMKKVDNHWRSKIWNDGDVIRSGVTVGLRPECDERRMVSLWGKKNKKGRVRPCKPEEFKYRCEGESFVIYAEGRGYPICV